MDNKKLLYEWELEEKVEDEINELYSKVKLLNYEYDVATTVKKTDPTVWRMAVRDTIDRWVEEGRLRETVDSKGRQCWERIEGGTE